MRIRRATGNRTSIFIAPHVVYSVVIKLQMDNMPRLKKGVLLAAIIAALAVSGLAAYCIVELVIGNAGAAKATATPVARVDNDTAQIMRLVMDTCQTRDGLPDAEYLGKNNPFGDSVIMCNEGWTIDWSVYFPRTWKVKLLDKAAICTLAAKDPEAFAYILEIQSFKKTDSTYEMALRNTCVFFPFRNMVKTRRNARVNRDSCVLGFRCGGTLFMGFKKAGDRMHTYKLGVLWD